MEIVLMVSIVTIVVVALIAAALYLIDKDADRRDSVQNERRSPAEDR